jgi:hypothetical protein
MYKFCNSFESITTLSTRNSPSLLASLVSSPGASFPYSFDHPGHYVPRHSYFNHDNESAETRHERATASSTEEPDAQNPYGVLSSLLAVEPLSIPPWQARVRSPVSAPPSAVLSPVPRLLPGPGCSPSTWSCPRPSPTCAPGVEVAVSSPAAGASRFPWGPTIVLTSPCIACRA